MERAISGVGLSIATLLVGFSTVAAAESTAKSAPAGDRARFSPSAIYTRTDYVEDLAADEKNVFVATRGGLARLDRATLLRARLYTTLDGLDDNHVRSVQLNEAHLAVRTAASLCVLGPDDRFACVTAPALPSDTVQPATAMLDGVRVTRTLSLRPATLMGTAGHGLFLDEKGGLAAHPIASSNEICGNHAMAFARFAGHLVIATFDEGLCLRDGDRFMKIDALPFRMVNDLAVFRGSLFVAANEGLFRSQDGVKFERVVLGDETLDGGNRGFNRLALDGGRLWATTPGALVRIGARRVNITWAPGGSTALQAVSVAGGHVWLASEDRGVMRREADGRFTLFDRAAGLPSSWMVDVAATPDGGALAATLRHGLVRIHADGQFEPISGLPDAWMLRVSPAKRGGFYVGTQGGAAFLDNRGGVTRIPLTAGPCVHAFFEDGGHLWVGTESGTTLHQN